jgi:hypothetical protein
MKVKDEAEEPGKAIVAVVADKNWRSEASGREEQGPKGRLTNLSFDSLWSILENSRSDPESQLDANKKAMNI